MAYSTGLGCPWCGSDGICCKKNKDSDYGCDGIIGGENRYQCALKPGNVSFIYLISNL